MRSKGDTKSEKLTGTIARLASNDDVRRFVRHIPHYAASSDVPERFSDLLQRLEQAEARQ